LRIADLAGWWLAAGMAALLAAPAAGAITVAYWRMEVDNHNAPQRVRIPNEVAGGSDLESTEAVLDGSNLPTTIVPLTDDPNSLSLASAFQGGTNGINASAAWYDALSVTSISVEYWARTQETVATPFQFTTGGLDGIVITNPNALSVTWHVDVGGIPTAFTMSNLDDMDANWSHYAFVYDEVTGQATFYVDGVVVGFFDGPDGSPLVIVPGTSVEIGVLMDYASAGQGTMDEVRIDGTALGPLGLLLVPEPATGLQLALGLVWLAARGRRRALRA
jgi:hypothetical protein